MLTMVRREWRSSALRLAVFSLVVAIAGMSTVTFFTDRLQRGLDDQRRVLLGGDYALVSDQLIEPGLISLPQPTVINQTQILTFLSMVSYQGQIKLANIKAIDNHYPLLGQMTIKETMTADASKTKSLPQPGQVWLSQEILVLLKAKMGDTIKIGKANFKISAIIASEPDQGERWFAIAPRILMHSQDIEKTDVIIPGSRLQQQVLFTGDQSVLAEYIAKLSDKLNVNQRLLSAETYQPVLTRLIERTQHYLELATLLTLLLSGIAITIALLQYFQQRYNMIALMRCFGLTMNDVIRHFSKLFASLGLVACIIGCFIGYLGQKVLAHILASILGIELPLIHFGPAGWASLSGLMIFLGVSLPLLLNCKHVPPTYLFRHIDIPTRLITVVIAAVITAVLLMMLYLYTQDGRLTLIMSAACVGLIVVLFPINLGIITLLNATRDKLNLTWQFAIANLYRNRKQASLELLTFSLIITVLLLTTLIRNDVIEQWQSTPKQTPNYFVINIAPDEVAPLQQFLAHEGLQKTPFYPMIRGRILSLNSVPIMSALSEEKKVHNALNRALNFSWAEKTPDLKQIVQGQWWSAEDEARGAPLVSLESNLATQLGFKLNDTIGVQIGNEKINARVVNMRQVDWRSFEPNFYMLFPKKLLASYPTTFISSLFIPEAKLSALQQLNQQFPAITFIDVAAITNQFQSVMNNLALAIEFILVFTIIAAILILITTLIASMEYRTRQHAIIRALGGSRRLLKQALMLEFSLLGGLAGCIAMVAANGLGYVFSKYILGVAYTASYSIWFLIPISTALMVGLVSYLIERNTLTVSPREALG